MEGPIGMAGVALVIPFFNERDRLNLSELKELSERAADNLDCYLVDDGSTDDYTLEIFTYIAKEKLNNIYVIKTPFNNGKSEAIRFGANNIDLLEYKFLGITDADFSASPTEIMRLAVIALEGENKYVFGARIRNGTNIIETSWFRYLQGLLFNRSVTLILGQRFLDSQCGLKYFLVDTNLIEALKKPFTNRWLFDLEIILRLSKLDTIKVSEVILNKWVHTKGSKTSIKDIIPVFLALLSLRLRYGKCFVIAEKL